MYCPKCGRFMCHRQNPDNRVGAGQRKNAGAPRSWYCPYCLVEPGFKKNCEYYKKEQKYLPPPVGVNADSNEAVTKDFCKYFKDYIGECEVNCHFYKQQLKK